MAQHIYSANEITKHASSRMSARAINKWQIDQVVLYGRESHSCKAIIYAIGRNEVKEYGKFLEPCEGIHVLCSLRDGSVITTYRNHNLKKLRQ